TPPLVVQLSGPAESDVMVNLTIMPSNVLTGPMMVTIPTGQSSATLMLTGAMASGTPATVTASYEGNMTTANVLAYNDSTARNVRSLTPDPVTITTSNSAMMTVTLDLPATAGTTVDLMYTGAVSGPASVPVTAGQTTAM